VPLAAQVVIHTIIPVSSTATSTTNNAAAWANIPGASVNLTIPAGHTDTILARFSGESLCWGMAGWCQLRILANGVELDAQGGVDFAFDSSDNNTETAASWASHAIERYRRITNTANVPVAVNVVVQYKVSAAGLNFRVDDWNFTVQQHH
jgi:hypothetical protein